MKILIIKLSSLGDVVHLFPALNELQNHHPDYRIDWVVEEEYVELVQQHPFVQRVIPYGLRRWRKQKSWREAWQAWRHFKKELRKKTYDMIIDAQGLYKSAWIAWHAKGVRVGLAYDSAREPLSTLAIQKKYLVDKSLHAIQRLRILFAQVFNYSIDPGQARQQPLKLSHTIKKNPRVIFLHGTTWPTKRWPLAYWCELADKFHHAGWHIKVSWGNEAEKAFAEQIQQQVKGVEIMPRISYAAWLSEFKQSDLVIAVDTGLAHLAHASGVDVLSIYGPTDPALTGLLNHLQWTLQPSTSFSCVPCKQEKCRMNHNNPLEGLCMLANTPEQVWEKVEIATQKDAV